MQAATEGPAPGTPDNAHPGPSTNSLNQACSVSDSEPDAALDAHTAAATQMGLGDADAALAGTCGELLALLQMSSLAPAHPTVGTIAELGTAHDCLEWHDVKLHLSDPGTGDGTMCQHAPTSFLKQHHRCLDMCLAMSPPLHTGADQTSTSPLDLLDLCLGYT